MNTVKLTHPNSRLTLDVDPDQVDMYRSQGWVEKSPKKTTADRASGKGGTAPHTTTKKEEA